MPEPLLALLGQGSDAGRFHRRHAIGDCPTGGCDCSEMGSEFALVVRWTLADKPRLHFRWQQRHCKVHFRIT